MSADPASGQVTWAPSQGLPPTGAWTQPAVRRSVPPDVVLRAVSGGLALLAGVLLAGSTVPDLVVGPSESLSGWGTTGEGPALERPLLLGIPLVLAAVALGFAGTLLLVSAGRPARRPAALTATVAAVGLSTPMAWIVGSYVDGLTAAYRSIDVEGVSAEAGPGSSLLVAGAVTAALALACLLLAELQARLGSRPAAPVLPSTVAPPPWPVGAPPYGAPPSGAPPYGAPAPSPWEGPR